MLKLMLVYLAILSSLISPFAHAGSGGFQNDYFAKQIYFAFGGTGHGTSYSAALPLTTNAAIWTIPAGAVITRVYVIVDVAVTGTTVINVGDTNGATSFCPTAAVTLGTPGMYCWDAKAAGAYMRIQTAGATDAGDIYVVPNAKYYSTAVALAIAFTTTNTAGKLRVIVEGYFPGARS